MNYRTVLLAILLDIAVASPVTAHHSAAMFDTTRQVVIEGVVTRYDWKNPHIYMAIEARAPDGSTFEQAVEAGAPSVLLPLGLTASSVAVGERVTVHGNPNKGSPRAIVLGRSLTKQDGTELPLNIGARSVRTQPDDAQATGLAGTWFAPLGPFRTFREMIGSWPLTDKGRRAVAEFDIRNASYADCVPVTAPTLMIYPVATTVEIRADRVIFNVDWMGSQRIVYTDGREHPANGAPTLQGHSVGHWEGQTLVVDTVQFAAHTEGITLGVPSSEGKHTVERFSLADDRRHMTYEVTLEDPEYLRESISYRSQLDYRPDLEPTGLACDRDVARRYLTPE